MISLCLIMAVAASAQFLSLQAATPEEYDAYLNVIEASKPLDVIAAAEAMEKRWPRSELLAGAWEFQMEAYRTLGDAEGAIRAGERVLKLAPNHIGVLVTLASILSNGTSDPKRLERAQVCAGEALKQLMTFHAPRTISLETWEQLRLRLDSEAHAALGMVAFKQNRPETAVKEFETAVTLAPQPDPVQHYRLGTLYMLQGRMPEAREKLERAARLNNPAIQKLAENALRGLKK